MRRQSRPIITNLPSLENILWYLIVYYRVQNSPHLDHILRHMNPGQYSGRKITASFVDH
jgi:hypothetical protein